MNTDGLCNQLGNLKHTGTRAPRTNSFWGCVEVAKAEELSRFQFLYQLYIYHAKLYVLLVLAPLLKIVVFKTVV